MLAFACPHCGKDLDLRAAKSAAELRCPGCRHLVPLPATAPILAPPAAEDGSGAATHGDVDRPQESGDTHGEPADTPSELTDFLAPAQAPDELGRLGGYRVLQVLGAGGMGVVYKAEDPNLQRLVAVKAMLPGLGSSAHARQRFLREARSAAALKHDHVVTIFQVGEERGAPFLAMEFLEGEPLDERLKHAGPLPVPEVLRIGRQVALGLAAAHKRGMIHRDIKPANLWLEAETGRVKILDFGLARGTSDEAHLTQSGAIVGTPAYMAPEQAQGQPVDARTDLFSLGCVLYRLCTGQNPFRGTDTISTLMAVATADPPPPGQLNAAVPPGLSDLVMRLLAKDPAGRPASAQEVAAALADLEADRTQPLTASVQAVRRPAPAAATAPRRRMGYFLGAAAVLLLLTGGSVVLWQVIIRIHDEQGKEIGKVELKKGQSFTVERPGVPAAKAPADAVPPGQLVVATPRSPFDALQREQIPTYELKVAGGGDPAKAPAGLVAILGDSRLKHWDIVFAVAFDREGKRIASASNDRTVKVWDARTGQELLSLTDGSTTVYTTTFSPDGARLASGGSHGALRVWSAASGALDLILKGHKGTVRGLAFSKDGKRLISGGEDGTVKVWDAATGQDLLTLTGHSKGVRSVAISPDGSRLASRSDDQTVKIWDAATGKDLHTLAGHVKDPSWNSLAFSPDGRHLATGGHNKGVTLWDVSTGREARSLPRGHCVAFSPDGKRLASSVLATVTIWDLVTNQKVLTHQEAGHHYIYSIAFSPDGKRVVTGGEDARLYVWDASTGKDLIPTGDHERGVGGVAVSPDGTCLASGSADRLIVWNAGTAQERFAAKLDLFDRYIFSIGLGFSPDGKRLVSPSGRGTFLIRDASSGEVLLTLKSDKYARPAAVFSPDGKHLATFANPETVVRIWTATGEFVRPLGHGGPVRCLAFSPDGKRLASGSSDATVKVWNVGTGETLRTLEGVRNVNCLAFSPDGKRLLTTDFYGAARVWDAETGQELQALAKRSGSFTAAFNPDGKTAVTGQDRRLILWETASWGKRHEWPLPGEIFSVAFAPDGRHLITANPNGTVYILRLAGPTTAAAKANAP